MLMTMDSQHSIEKLIIDTNGDDGCDDGGEEFKKEEGLDILILNAEHGNENSKNLTDQDHEEKGSQKSTKPQSTLNKSMPHFIMDKKKQINKKESKKEKKIMEKMFQKQQKKFKIGISSKKSMTLSIP